MTLSDLASIGSFISALAVLVSLVYLSLQVRQAEQNQKAMMQQARTDRSIDLNMEMWRDPTFFELSQKLTDPSYAVSYSDVRRFVAFQRAIFLNGENAFYQFQHGMMHEDAYKTWERTIRYNVSVLASRAAWIETRTVFGPEYVEFIDRLIAGTPVFNEKSEDALDRWNKNIGKELALGTA